MRVVFISNYISHHQKPFSDAMYRRLGTDYIFIQSEPMEEERQKMGWGIKLNEIPYLKLMYEDRETCVDLIMNADIVIAGWTKDIDVVIKRMQKGKITLRVSERIYREGQWKFISPMGLIAKYKEHIRFRKSPAYLLCAGAYVPSDFSLIKAYPDKMYKFGYFPAVRHYDLEELFQLKDASRTIEIVFAGRFLKLKHPEYMIWLARDLAEENRRRKAHDEPLLPEFRIHMIGEGELENALRSMVTKYKLLDTVLFYGFQSPDKVRAVMERSHIHVFPSNELEGWGAVVNESMNSACAVVASAGAGAVPYLIKNWENGVAFPNNDYDSMKEAVRYLMTHGAERETLAKNAYATITKEWNAEDTVDTLMYMMEGWLQGLEHPPMDGPLSVAEVVKPANMFKYIQDKGAQSPLI